MLTIHSKPGDLKPFVPWIDPIIHKHGGAPTTYFSLDLAIRNLWDEKKPHSQTAWFVGMIDHFLHEKRNIYNAFVF